MSEPDLWYPTDAWIADQIRHAKGWAPDRPVPASMIAAFRAAMRQEALRLSKWRRENPDPRMSMPRRLPAPRDGFSDLGFALEVLSHPYLQAMIGVMLWMPGFLANAAAEAGTLFRPPIRWKLVPLLHYVRNKIPAVEGTLITHAHQSSVSPLHYAAINGMSLRAAIEWNERMTRLVGTQQYAAVDEALAELDELGRRAVLAAAPLRIDQPEVGPPRDLLRLLSDPAAAALAGVPTPLGLPPPAAATTR